jgi:ubiquinone/menaquinone biosynthesis C-methylase UbiE
MSAGGIRAVSSVPTGNTFDKYGSSSPVVRRLMAGFERALDELIGLAAPESILDVGCGEGVLSGRWAERLAAATVVGLDLADPALEEQWRALERPNLSFVTGRAEQLPFAGGEFDLVAAIETLEHVREPDRALSEMARVARRHVLVSVPREPIWRVLNVARGAYVSRLGDTPGHLHHWSRQGLVRLLASHGKLIELRAPLPWSIALVSVG